MKLLLSFLIAPLMAFTFVFESSQTCESAGCPAANSHSHISTQLGLVFNFTWREAAKKGTCECDGPVCDWKGDCESGLMLEFSSKGDGTRSYNSPGVDCDQVVKEADGSNAIVVAHFHCSGKNASGTTLSLYSDANCVVNVGDIQLDAWCEKCSDKKRASAGVTQNSWCQQLEVVAVGCCVASPETRLVAFSLAQIHDAEIRTNSPMRGSAPHPPPVVGSR